MLRPKIHYHQYFYYWCMVTNFILRWDWLITAFVTAGGYPFLFGWGYGTGLGMLGLYRRWQWALLRVENEQVNNLELYRTLLEIPDINSYE